MHQNFSFGPGKVSLFSSVTWQQQLRTEAVELAQKHTLGGRVLSKTAKVGQASLPGTSR